MQSVHSYTSESLDVLYKSISIYNYMYQIWRSTKVPNTMSARVQMGSVEQATVVWKRFRSIPACESPIKVRYDDQASKINW